MQFQVLLPLRLDVYLLYQAGIDAGSYYKAYYGDNFGTRAKLPLNITCPYYRSDGNTNVHITRTDNPDGAEFTITVDDEQIGIGIESFLRRYDVEHDGEASLDREHNLC